VRFSAYYGNALKHIVLIHLVFFLSLYCRDKKVLTLARELSQGTIDKVMATSNVELGLEMLINWPKR
jgi:hypothetical protein